MNLANQSILEGLNKLLENKAILEVTLQIINIITMRYQKIPKNIEYQNKAIIEVT